MPYSIVKRGSRYCIQKDTDGSIVKGSCHDSKEETARMMRALYASEDKSMDDILIGFGSELKLLPNGHIGGHLVRFTRSDQPDLAGDFFDAKTDFGIDGEIKSPVYLNHRLPLETSKGKSIVVKEKIGEATLKMADDGVVIDAILYERKKYEKALTAMGWSSGTAGHLTERTKIGKSYHVDAWPLGLDASITPTPCDPGNVCSLKAYKAAVLDDGESAQLAPSLSLAASLTRYIDDMSDEVERETVIKSLARESMLEVADVEAILDGTTRRPSNAKLKAFSRVLKVKYDTLKSIADNQRGEMPSIKGMFEEELAGKQPSSWDLRNTLCCVVKKIAEAAKASRDAGAPFDASGRVREAFAEYSRRDEAAIASQVLAYADGDWDSEMMGDGFYLKSLSDPSDLAMESIAPEDHCSLAESAFKSVVARMRKFNATRVKAGRVLSDKNRTRLADMLSTIKQAVSDCEMLLEETKPMATDEAMRAAKTKHLRLQWERNRGASQNV